MKRRHVKTICVRMIRRDLKVVLRPADAVNTLPIKCPHCGFPNIDYVPSPYLLGKSISGLVEIAAAQRGNFLVRDKVRRILELIVPDTCAFHPTADARSQKATAWWLAVPKLKLKASYPADSRPICSRCGNSKWGIRLAEAWGKMSRFDSRGIDVFKSSAWQTMLIWGDFTPERTCYLRDLYFSVRLETLLIRLGVNRLMIGGMLEREDFTYPKVEPSNEDEVWILEKLKLLAEHGLIDASKPTGGKPSSASEKWFKRFLSRNAVRGINAVDFDAVEIKRKLTLPVDYKDFIATIGPKAFKNVCQIEETVTSILLPQRMDFRNFRRGKAPRLENADVDGVVFAETDFGDCFVFDVSVKNGEYPVYWYRHEENTLEPFAPNFAECIKRFVQKN